MIQLNINLENNEPLPFRLRFILSAALLIGCNKASSAPQFLHIEGKYISIDSIDRIEGFHGGAIIRTTSSESGVVVEGKSPKEVVETIQRSRVNIIDLE